MRQTIERKKKKNIHNKKRKRSKLSKDRVRYEKSKHIRSISRVRRERE